jgi:N-acetylneuraminate synthase
MSEITIAGRKIGLNHNPFVIAELSGNHQQSLALAKSMVDAAAAAGVDAIKLQTYTADSMTLDCDHGEFFISDQGNLWKGQSLHTLYGHAATPYDWHKYLFDYANSLGLIAFSSPFDHSAVDFLMSLNVPAFKVASFENNDIPLIEHIARTGKPVILSTGMASEDELALAVDTLRSNGCSQFALLKCTSAYPATPDEANLLTIPALRSQFDCEVGLSDHTLGDTLAIASVALGASIIEKHFVLNRKDGGVDSAFSLQPGEFQRLVEQVTIAQQARGTVFFGASERESDSVKFRRSIYISTNIKAGEEITADNIRVIRPGLGLAPKHWQDVIGKQFTRDAKKGTALSWDLIL